MIYETKLKFFVSSMFTFPLAPLFFVSRALSMMPLPALIGPTSPMIFIVQPPHTHTSERTTVPPIDSSSLSLLLSSEERCCRRCTITGPKTPLPQQPRPPSTSSESGSFIQRVLPSVSKTVSERSRIVQRSVVRVCVSLSYEIPPGTAQTVPTAVEA